MDEATKAKVNATLSAFVGAHYFHNYTSGKVPMEPSAQRYIYDFAVDEVVLRDGLECAMIKVKGQSFMLHQIRKMIGMTIAVVRGHASDDVLEAAWAESRIDVPRAPGLGLLLDTIHFERYNQRFGGDGIHDPLEWSQGEVADRVKRFVDEQVIDDIVKTEKAEKSMFEWMKNLPLHTFQPRHFESKESEKSPLKSAFLHVKRARLDDDCKEEKEEARQE